VEPYLPNDELLLEIMRRSSEILKGHPVNRSRVDRGLRPATSLWPWGEGKAVQAPTLLEEYGLTGAMISAVDLLKACAG
jgi:2,3-bisphosphoglycerate-independent phosphoglycerate mutase